MSHRLFLCFDLLNSPKQPFYLIDTTFLFIRDDLTIYIIRLDDMSVWRTPNDRLLCAKRLSHIHQTLVDLMPKLTLLHHSIMTIWQTHSKYYHIQTNIQQLADDINNENQQKHHT